MIIGHSPLTRYFELAVKNGTLGATYCLAGREQVGKRTVARWVASQLFNIAPVDVDRQADFYYVARTTDEKTGKMKTTLTVDQMRALKQRLSAQSWSSGYQVVVVDEAESILESGANALLKVLEEPPARTIIFLLTTSAELLLPTIRSRAEVFFLSPVPTTQIAEALIKNYSLDEAMAWRMASAADGRPGRAVQFATDSGVWDDFNHELARWSGLLRAPVYIRMKMIEEWFGDKRTAPDTLRLAEILMWWEQFWRDRLWSLSCTAKEVPEYFFSYNTSMPPGPVSAAAGALDALAQGREQLYRHVDGRLVLENFLLHL